jgi:chromosomal replication initiator protein
MLPLVAEPEAQGLVLVCPSAFHRDRVQSQYLGSITECVEAEAGEHVGVELRVELRAGAAAAPAADAGDAGESPPAAARPGVRPTAKREDSAPRLATPGRGDQRPIRRQTTQPAEVAARPAAAATLPYTFDNFVVGPCNALAREASLAIARDRQMSLNQLYLHSTPGMGKTHLSRAVAAEGDRLRGGHVRYVSAEGFTNEFMAALRGKRTGEFKQRYRQRCRLLVVDDVQFLQSKTATQLEFFHTVQHVIDAGGRVVLTGDRAPQDLDQLSERVRGQLGCGFVAELETPDAAVRRDILRSKAAHGGVHLPPACLDRLVEAVPGSVRELEGVLIQLVTTASLLKHPIDLHLTETAIAKKTLSRACEARRLDVPSVVRVVAGFFRTTPERIAGRSRRRDVLVPRQLAMYLCQRYTEASTGEIGRALGRSHPSVRNAILKVEREILERAPLRYQVEALAERLDQRLREQD